MTAPRELTGRRSNDRDIVADVRADLARAAAGDTEAADRLAAYRAECDARVSAIDALIARTHAQRIRQAPARAVQRAQRAADAALVDKVTREYREALARDTVEHVPPVRLPVGTDPQ